MEKIAFIGFGEAAAAFVSGWTGCRARVGAYDIQTDDASARDAMAARYREHSVVGASTAGDALVDADVVFSTVTADQALVAAEAAAPHLRGGALWLDCNSCAPQTKIRAAKAVEASGGRFVDVAVMAPVHPRGHLVPLLVSGLHSGLACEALRALDMRPTVAGETVGQASAIKMLRSVMIKGLEALTAECFLAARRAGVEAQVLASLETSDPDIDWRGRGIYNLDRMMIHGERRAAEMREVALTVSQLGLPASMSAAAVEWQEAVAALDLQPSEDEDLWGRSDRLLARL